MTETWFAATLRRVPRDRAETAVPAWTEASFEAFHAETSAPLWRYLLRVSGDPTLAEDVLQESFLRVLERPGRHAEPRRRRAYLFQIATNLLRDRWRRARRETIGVDEETLERPNRFASPAPPRDARLDVHAVLGDLRRRERALLWLACVEGCSHDEVADILGVRSRSVRVMLHRAKKKLADALAARGYRRITP